MESLTKKRKKAKWKIRESSPGPPPEAVTRDDFPEIFNINDGTEEIIDNAEDNGNGSIVASGFCHPRS